MVKCKDCLYFDASEGLDVCYATPGTLTFSSEEEIECEAFITKPIGKHFSVEEIVKPLSKTKLELEDSDEIPAISIQVGGDHYKKFKIQPVEFIMQNDLSFCVGSVIKYVCRYKNKNGKQDLEKAKHYIDLLIEEDYGNS